MMIVINELVHNGAKWLVVQMEGSYFASCAGSLTGPYSTSDQAEDFIKAIRPSTKEKTR